MATHQLTSLSASTATARGLIVALFALSASLLPGCTFDGSGLEARQCSVPEDCPFGQTCELGYCQRDDDMDDDVGNNNDNNNEPQCPTSCPSGRVQFPTAGADCPFDCCIDDDGDGFPSEACGGVVADCDDGARNGARRFPGNPEICDGVDNDCDELIDLADIDDLQAPPCMKQQGVCMGSVMHCAGAAGFVECTTADYEAFSEGAYLVEESYCAGGAEGLDATTGLCKTTAAGAAILADGITGPSQAEEALCDGLDNDCDGVPDEPEVAIPCYDGADVTQTASTFCRGGQRACVGGGYAADCTGQQLPEVEDTEDLRCDAIDQDCDGILLTQCACMADMDCYTGLANTEDRGICVGGSFLCVDNFLNEDVCVDEVLPGVESCANLTVDDDCDGKADELGDIWVNNTPVERFQDESCTATRNGAPTFGQCQIGTLQCVNDAVACVPTFEPTFERCADLGTDNNCDGTPQDLEGLSSTGVLVVLTEADVRTSPQDLSATGCSAGLQGICNAGEWSCLPQHQNDGRPTCAQVVPADLRANAEAFCNDVDDDCDGMVDEDAINDVLESCGSCNRACGGGESCCTITGGGYDCFDCSLPASDCTNRTVCN